MITIEESENLKISIKRRLSFFCCLGGGGPQIPDSPSVKVFSKKKVAERTQQSLRSFSVPLRPPGSSANVLSSGGRAGVYAAASKTTDKRPLVEVTVPGNLPRDADDVVERLRSSLKSFRQVRCFRGRKRYRLDVRFNLT